MSTKKVTMKIIKVSSSNGLTLSSEATGSIALPREVTIQGHFSWKEEPHSLIISPSVDGATSMEYKKILSEGNDILPIRTRMRIQGAGLSIEQTFPTKKKS